MRTIVEDMGAAIEWTVDRWKPASVVCAIALVCLILTVGLERALVIVALLPVVFLYAVVMAFIGG